MLAGALRSSADWWRKMADDKGASDEFRMRAERIVSENEALCRRVYAALVDVIEADVIEIEADDFITEHDIDTILPPEPNPPEPPPTADFDTLDRLAASHTGSPRHDPAPGVGR